MDRLIEIITEMIRRRRWQKLMTVVRGLMEFDSSLYLKRNRGAVDRVKEAFQRIHHKPAYPPASTDWVKWDREIAVIVDTTGVGPLIDDMKASVNYYPASIFYYIHSVSGKTPRWDLIMYDEIRRRDQADKELFDAMAKAYEELSLQAVNRPDPEWVVQARRRWAELSAASKRIRGMEYQRAIQEMKTIEARIKMQGYSLQEEN